ncbi:DUF4389 domain-containing protein [Rathayibacter caricis]|uniref:DUF4389 domain-containing protein n=1 Tax=Rathayibacter caricis TaxID=110936 RepID=UPI001FB1A83F|nr:DUF4389 domain-containing protein [Rathayibacter caricis]MCJ1697914.1 DUF4389 domain-containing protein [Rathayibacter caricis]
MTTPTVPGRSSIGPLLLLGGGVIVTTLAAVMITAGGLLFGAGAAQGEDGSLRTDPIRVQTQSSALVSEPLRVNVEDTAATRAAFSHAVFTLSSTSTDGAGDVFVGVGPTADIDRYLENVAHADVSTLSTTPGWTVLSEQPGDRAATAPTTQTFWVASSTDGDPLEMTATRGEWTVVVMNPDGRAGLDVGLQAGVRSDLFTPFGAAALGAGVLLLLAGALLIVMSAILLGGRLPEEKPIQSSTDPYPSRLTGTLDAHLSRGLWLVKWILALPHLVILAFLWAAVAVTSVVAGFAILFTTHYPRPLFAFTIGVIRWSWRVTFYAFAPLGTDKYPPFTLAEADYPATFTVERAPRYSRGLVLVKSWLLAIPHLVIVGIFTSAPATVDVGDDRTTIGFSLLGALSLIVGAMLLFTGRYRPALFALIMGLCRWNSRVLTYVLLLRDEYPPFRLDQGPTEPTAIIETTPLPIVRAPLIA